MSNNGHVGWFTRIVVAGLAIFILGLIAASFFKGQPSFTISPGLIILTLIVVVLALSESFNSFSIGKLFSLSRDVSKAETSAAEVKRENADLRQSLIQVATHIQSQVNTTIQAHGTDLLQLLRLVKADKDEVKDDEECPPQEPQKPDKVPSFRIFREVERIALDKFAEKNAIAPENILRDMKFADTIQGIDPISNRPVTFDGYLNVNQKEQFLDVRIYDRISPMLIDKLYVMLSKVLLYRTIKKAPVELILILAKIPQEDVRSQINSTDRFIGYFQPAIASGLLRVDIVDISKDEIDHINNELLKQ